jgi:hypothetical protein
MVCDGGGSDVIESVREFHALIGVHGTELGESPEGRLRQDEIDSPPILRYTDTIRPGDEGKAAVGTLM